MKKQTIVLTLVGFLAFYSTTPAQYVSVPTNVTGAGLSYIVPDMLLWYHTNNYYTNGPIMVGQVAPNSSIWDAYDSMVGDSTFLIANVTYANSYPDGQANLSHGLVFQPTVGGPPKLSREFCADDGTVYPGPISARKTGNAGRIAGDRRLGAVSYLSAAQCNAGDPVYTYTQPAAFQLDGRWATNANYVGDGRYPIEQTFSLNPATLVQTPLVKASDFTYGRSSSWGPISEDFGDVLCLSDGNYAIITADGTGNVYAGTTATIVIIRPDGSVVKDTFIVDPLAAASQGIWANCAAYRGGFCVRWNATLYFFDNAGNPMGSIAQSSSGVAFGTDRGDQTRIASDICSHYVYLAGAAPYAGDAHAPVYLAVWDAQTTNFVTAAVVSDTDPANHYIHAVNVAVDALDRVIVGYDLKPNPAFTNYTAGYPAGYQVAVRIMKFDGTNITFLTPSFFPFVNHDETGNVPIKTVTPGLAMTTKQICISAKGIVNSTNNPAAEPDTPDNCNLYTVITHPAPVELRPNMTITRSGSNVVVSWTDPASLGWTLQKTSPTIQPASWSTAGVGSAVQVGSTYYSTNAVGANTYYRLVHQY